MERRLFLVQQIVGSNPTIPMEGLGLCPRGLRRTLVKTFEVGLVVGLLVSWIEAYYLLK
jgi:hypothetical protein